MAQTAPPAINALPTPPSTLSPGDFDSRADAFLGALPARATEMNASGTVTYNNAVDAYNNAVIAQNSAASAASASATAVSAAGAPAWASGTTYAIGNPVYSPLNRMIYRRLIAGAGTTDPSLDPTNWAGVDTSLVVFVVSTASASASSGAHYVLTYGGVVTVTLPPSPAVGDQVWISVANSIDTNVVARNGKTIMGFAEDMVISHPYATVKLRYVNTSWRVI